MAQSGLPPPAGAPSTTRAVHAVTSETKGLGEADDGRTDGLDDVAATTTSPGSVTCRGAIGASASHWGSLNDDGCSAIVASEGLGEMDGGGQWRRGGDDDDNDDVDDDDDNVMCRGLAVVGARRLSAETVDNNGGTRRHGAAGRCGGDGGVVANGGVTVATTS